MHLIDIDRAAVGVEALAAREPRAVVPLVALDVVQLGGRLRRSLGMEGVRIRFHQGASIFGLHAELI